MNDAPIILYDGDCGFCNRSIQFVLNHERSPLFRFTALQSEAGIKLLQAHGLPTSDPDTIVLIDGNRSFVRSTAALRIARGLRWPWRLLSIFLIIPRIFRDPVYRFIARIRHHLAPAPTCSLVTPQTRQRFI